MLILASGSPRRKEIFELVKLNFKVEAATIDEKTLKYEGPIESYPAFLSLAKADNVYQKHTNDTIVAADTIVIINGEVLGKPKDEKEAKIMLKKLADNIHTVITGVTIKTKDKCLSFSESSEVEFYPLTNQEIENYIKTKEPMDKAGAYAIQGVGAKFIKRIEGDFYNVMGLPIARLLHILDENNIKY